jgi:GTP-binding protein
MIEAYLTSRESLAALVVLVDGDLGAQPSDVEMVRWAETLGRKVIVVATKLDKLSRVPRGQQVQKIAGVLAVPEVLAFSAKEHFGVEELWRALVSA